MADHVFDVAAFRLTFPAFADAGTFPDAMLQMYWDLGTSYISASDGWALNGATLQNALNMMAAHLTWSFKLITDGTQAVVIKGSTIDKTQVQLEPPPVKDAWQWWLATTPYGQMLWGLLSATSAGGFFIPGRPERAAFRKVGGRF
jgi:carbohydrate-selective porin OprB